MRGLRLIAALAALTFGLSCQQTAYAAGNVLLPDDDTSHAMPGLGLGPTAKPSPEKPAATPPSESTAPKNTNSENILPAVNPARVSTPLPQTPARPPPPPTNTATQFRLPTRVIEMPLPESIINSSDSDWPNNLTLKIADKYVWGTFDTSTINSNLGIAPAQIPARCHLSASGIATGDEGYFAFDTGIAHSETPIRYAGAIKNITLQPRAVCDRIALPPNSGYVFQIGDKYTVSLGQVSCPPPPEKAKDLIFSYAGDGKGQCSYR